MAEVDLITDRSEQEAVFWSPLNNTGWSNSLVDGILALGPRLPGSLPSSGKNFAFHNTLISSGSRR